jgi:hypothetical protein
MPITYMNNKNPMKNFPAKDNIIFADSISNCGGWIWPRYFPHSGQTRKAEFDDEGLVRVNNSLLSFRYDGCLGSAEYSMAVSLPDQPHPSLSQV